MDHHSEVKVSTSDRRARRLKRSYSSAQGEVEGQAAMEMVYQHVMEAAGVEQVKETGSETPEDEHVEDTVVEATEEEQDGKSVVETPGEDLTDAADDGEEDFTDAADDGEEDLSDAAHDGEEDFTDAAHDGEEDFTDAAHDGEEDHEAAAKQTESQLCEHGRAEVNRLLQENRELRSELNKKRLDKEFFKDDTQKVRYYTGVQCFAVLSSLFELVRPFLLTSNKLSQFQMVVLTLMRLRLDLPVQYLCHLFNVSHTTLWNTFADTVDVLYARLQPMVLWPQRHCIQATMPRPFFETFGERVAIIIDCFEIDIERPSKFKARAQTFSHDKGRHTMKYLIGFTPYGAICFISKGWGGCASDKHMIENCGLLSKLLPGDIVLAARGFDIKDRAGMMCAEVKTPSFTEGTCQLEAKDVAVAHLRILVERMIDFMGNEYKILHRTIPVRWLLACEGEEMVLLDKIVYMCCILMNMSPSVVVKPNANETCTC